MKSLVRVFNDFAPLVGFFIAYKFYGMMAATGVVLVLWIIEMGLSYWIERNYFVRKFCASIRHWLIKRQGVDFVYPQASG